MYPSSNLPGLKKSFGLNMAIVIVVSSMLGSGVFKKVAPMAEVLGSPFLVVLAFALAGLITLFGMWSIAELGAMYPDAGGPISWLEKMYGKKIAFLYGWSCFSVIQTAAIASIAFVFAGALSFYFPLPDAPSSWDAFQFWGVAPFHNLGAKLTAVLLIIALTFINIRGAKHSGWLNMIVTCIILCCIMGIISVALGSDRGGAEVFTTSAFELGNLSKLGWIGTMVIAMRHAFWAYEGWAALGFMGEELHRPEKNIPKALTYGMVIIISMYVLVNFAYLYVLPIEEMLVAINADENRIPAVLVIDKIFGSGGAYVISAMIMIATMGCTNATILVSSRIYYAMANKGQFFKRIGKIHAKNKTPSNSLILQCLWACILVFSGSFDTLTDLVIIVAFMFYGLIVGGVMVLRSKESQRLRPYKTWGYPMVPIIFVLFCMILLLVTFLESPKQSFLGILLVMSGLPFYYHWRKRYSIRS